MYEMANIDKDLKKKYHRDTPTNENKQAKGANNGRMKNIERIVGNKYK